MAYNVINIIEKRYIMDISSIQEFLNGIEGIESCKIVGNGDEMVEIHVVSDSARSPKHISRDVESAIMAQFGIKIDRKIISIVQLKDTESKFISRIKFAGVSLTSNGSVAEVEAKLLFDGREYISRQIGVNTVPNINRLVSEATLKALEQVIGQAYVMYTNDVVINLINDYKVVTVMVTFKLKNSEELLAGAAVVKNDLNEAIARAALDAVNRKIRGIKF